MRHDEGRLEGVGKISLYRQAWLPDGEPRAVVFMAHGASEHSGRYQHVGEALAAAGFALHALDHRGHGRSDGARAVVDRMAHLASDLHALRGHAEAQHPGKPVFLLGHSMGGTVALRYVQDRQDGLAGMIVSAPVAVLEAGSPVELFAAGVISRIAPKLGVHAIESGAVSRDPEVVRDYDSDPLNFHGKLPARTVHEMAQTIKGFPQSVPRITVPLLVLSPRADRIVPPRASDLVHDLAGSQDKTIIKYDELYHEPFNEPERDRVIADVAAWLEARV